MTSRSTITGAFLLLVAVAIFVGITYRNSPKSEEPIIFSPTYMLDALWSSYKKTYIESSSGRTVDPQREDISTSEGQSYTMMRAVWQDDKATFDQSLAWTMANMKRPNDSLFSWLYGKKSDGNFGIVTEKGGNNTASDADTDIAFALIQASVRWQNPTYLEQAKQIIQDIWKYDVVTVHGVPYMAADDLERLSKTQIVINPSYLSPHAYRVFAQVDPTHNWAGVIDSSYDVIQKSIEQPLDKSISAYIPANWVILNPTTGAITAAPDTTKLDTNFGYDAIRVPFRLALDYQWNKDQRSLLMLIKMAFLSSEWRSNESLHALYAHDGTTISTYESPSVYGATMGYFMYADEANAKAFYEKRLLTLYSPDNQTWKAPIGYYDSNWAWFGMALYNERLGNYYPKPKP